MLYLPSVALVAVGLIVLVVLLVRAVRSLRRFNQVASLVATNTGDRAGMLRARSAAIQVAVRERRTKPTT